MLTRILASSVRIIPWTLGSPFLSFFYNGGILCACDGLTKIHKSYKKDTIIYIYIYIYIYNFNFSRFRFFPFSFYRLLFNYQIKLYLSKSMSN